MRSVENIEELAGRYPENEVMTDLVGLPSVTVRVPRFRMSDVLEGASDEPHPAFVRNGRTLDAVYISKFQNVTEDGVACSLPDRDPATGIDYDAAVRASTKKGRGWHLMTAAEWGAVALWCLKNRCLPYGNNDLGRDYRESEVTARIAYRDEEKGICRTATGTGPDSWSHDRTAAGIFDLNANVWEWSGGIRFVYGELQLLDDAVTADPSVESPHWRALDGRTGELLIPDGQGTTAHSVKLDMRDGVWTYTASALTDSLAKARFCPFNAVRADETVSAKAQELLAALVLLPWKADEALDGVDLYANNGAAERIPFRGGRWGQGVNAGLFKTCIDDPRTYSGAAVGFRAAYTEET